jgi:TonB family protein
MQIDIKQPCSANWETMKIVVNSRYCDKCHKKVIDFTNMDRLAIISYLIEHSDKSVCGRINPQFVDVRMSDLPFIVESLRKKSNNASFGILAALCLSLVACQETNSPHPNQHKQEITKYETSSTSNIKPSQKKTDSTKKQKQQIISIVPEIMGEIAVLPVPEPIDPMQYLEAPPIDLPIIETKQPTDSIYQFPTKSPEFPGGMDEMFKFIQNNIVYPDYEKENGIEGTVYLEFIVRKTGDIDNIKLLRGIKNGPNYEKEAIRLVKKMPKWNPGSMEGIQVSTIMRIPIKFKLD